MSPGLQPWLRAILQYCINYGTFLKNARWSWILPFHRWCSHADASLTWDLRNRRCNIEFIVSFISEGGMLCIPSVKAYAELFFQLWWVLGMASLQIPIVLEKCFSSRLHLKLEIDLLPWNRVKLTDSQRKVNFLTFSHNDSDEFMNSVTFHKSFSHHHLIQNLS